MRLAIQYALLEFNRAQPGNVKWYRSVSELSAADQSRVELRAEEINKEMVMTLCAPSTQC